MKVISEKKKYLDSKLFKIESYIQSGILFKEQFHEYCIDNKYIVDQEIQNLNLYVHEDYSGIITYNGNDRTRLKSGYIIDDTISSVSSEDIIEFSKLLFPYSSDKHEFLYLIPNRITEWKYENMKMFFQNEIIDIEECEIEILTILIKNKSKAKYNKHNILCDIHNFIEKSELNLKDQICYDELLNQSDYINNALLQLIENKDSESLEDLIFNKSYNSWFSWYIAKNYLNTVKFPTSNYDLYFIDKMVKHPEMLKDYWKNKLREKYMKNAG